MNELWKVLTDPRVSVFGILAAIVLGGFAAMWSGFRAMLGVELVPLQVPYLVSAGVTGLALIGGALGLLTIHIDRVNEAEERRQLAELRRAIQNRLEQEG